MKNLQFWNSGNGRDFIEWIGREVPAGSYKTELFYQFDKETESLVEKWLKSASLLS